MFIRCTEEFETARQGFAHYLEKLGFAADDEDADAPGRPIHLKSPV
jgi:hypothetical protein